MQASGVRTLRCFQCYQISDGTDCSHCGSRAGVPVADGPPPDFETSLLRSLADPGVPGEQLWDLLCLALRFTPSGGRVDDRFAEIALGDLTPEQHCVLGVYMCLSFGEEAQSAAHFATAREASSSPIRIGPASVEFEPAEGSSAVELRLRTPCGSESLGVLDLENIRWVQCAIRGCRGLAPLGWDDWISSITRRHGVIRALCEAFSTEGDALVPRPDSGFRSRWKEFQHRLGERRDRLAPLDEQVQISEALEARDRGTLRQLDVPLCVSKMVEAARNSMRLAAQGLQQEMPDCLVDEHVHGAFLEGGLWKVVAMREDLHRESTGAHAELRKALDYQGRLMRGVQEALNASLSDLSRRAGGLVWRLTAQTSFDEARDQIGLVVERAKEVAMIEQTDAYLQGLSQTLETGCSDSLHDLHGRRTAMESARAGFERLLRALGLVEEVVVLSGEAREWREALLEMGAGAAGVLELVARAESRIAHLVLV